MGFLSEIFGYVLNFLYNTFNNYGVAIILFSVLLRLLLIPITIKQQKTMKKSTKIQEAMKELQVKYKNNPEKLNQETIELYKKENMSPFSGCFSAILQILIILSVFWLVSQPLKYMVKVEKNEELKNIVQTYQDEINGEEAKSTYPEIQIISKIEDDYKEVVSKLEQEDVENKEELEKQKEDLEKVKINMDFLGVDLSKVPTQNLNDWRVYIIPLLYVLTSFASIKLTTAMQNNKDKKKDIIIKESKTEEEEAADSIAQMSNSMTYMMPIMSISIAIIAPLGLALYWLVSNILMIIERLIINKIMSSKEDEEDAK